MRELQSFNEIGHFTTAIKTLQASTNEIPKNIRFKFAVMRNYFDVVSIILIEFV